MGVCTAKPKREALQNVPTSFWHIEVNGADDNKVRMTNYKSKKALLIVNIKAIRTKTAQDNKDLNYLYDKFKDRGLEILVFPSTQGTHSKNREQPYAVVTRQLKQSSQFQVFGALQVNGNTAHPLYKYLRANSTLYDPVKKDCGVITSEMTKFLIDKYGNVVKMYTPNVDTRLIEKDVESLLSLT